LVVDTLGLPCGILIHTADIQDRDGGVDVIELAYAKYKSLMKIWADGGYAGNCIVRVREKTGIDLDIVRRIGDMSGDAWLPEDVEAPISAGFKVLRWRLPVPDVRLARAQSALEQGLRGKRRKFARMGQTSSDRAACPATRRDPVIWLHPLSGRPPGSAGEAVAV